MFKYGVFSGPYYRNTRIQSEYRKHGPKKSRMIQGALLQTKSQPSDQIPKIILNIIFNKKMLFNKMTHNFT